jgi:hypothetical protein
MTQEKKSFTEKMEEKTAQMKEKNKNKKKATRKQKVVASIVIPVSAVLVAVAIASPNNNHRETAPDKPVDTSYHATAEKKSNVKFNGESPDVEKAIEQIREIAVDDSLAKTEKIDKTMSLAHQVDVSASILSEYTNNLVINVRNGILLEDRAGVSDLIWLFKGEVVAHKNNHAGFNGEFADDFVQVVKNLYRGTDTADDTFIQENMAQLNANINKVEY